MCGNKLNDNRINEFLGLFKKGLSYGYTVIDQFKPVEKTDIERRDLLNQGKLVQVIEWEPCTRFYSIKEEEEEYFSGEHLEKVDGRYTNVFFSPFIYKVWRRGQKYSLHLTSLYVDLDDCLVEEALERIKKLPEALQQPTAIINSGGGVHIYWVLDFKHKVGKCLNLWKKTMRELKDILEGDPKVIDHTRLMRVPGSWNPKAQAMCSFVSFNPDLCFDLFEVAQGLGVFKENNSSRIRSKKPVKKPVLKKEQHYKASGYTQELRKEIIELLKMRAPHGADIGCRNNALLILKQLRATDDTLDYVNHEVFTTPLSEKEVQYIKEYKVNSEDVLSFPNRINTVRKLEVSPFEQQAFRYLVDEDVYEVNKATKSIKRRHLPSLCGYLLSLLQRKYAKKQGTLKELAAELSLSPKTVSKYKRYRNNKTDYAQVNYRAIEIHQEIDVTANYLPSLEKEAYKQQAVDNFYQLQELFLRFESIVEKSKSFQKKRLNNTEFRELFKLIQELEKLRNECM